MATLAIFVRRLSLFMQLAAVAASLIFTCQGSAQTKPLPQPAAASSASDVPASPVLKTFDRRQWLMGVNADVASDDGTPVIAVRGGQNGRPAGGARPIGHVAVAQGISLKEGTIDFEMKSSQRNPVNHNYIGVIFRAQDQRHYEVLYFRFCPGQLAGIQYASSSDGTDPWQQFQQPQFTRYGVFADKKWIKIHIELRGERMLLYMDQQAKPALDVPVLAGHYPAGSVGFWAFPTSGEGLFRNLRVTPGPLPGPEPAKGELSVFPGPPATAASSAGATPKGETAQNGKSSVTTGPSDKPGLIQPTQWARREMRGAKWEIADLDPKEITNGVLKGAGRNDVRRYQVIYKAAKLRGDFDLTAEYKGNCRIGLVCAEGQRGFIGILNSLDTRSDLRIRRNGKKIEFTLGGQPMMYNKASTSEETPFYFGLVLDSGMQGEVSGIRLSHPAQRSVKMD